MTSRETAIPVHLPSPKIPDRVATEGLETKWDQIWEKTQIYKFNRDAAKKNIFSIDTPPPTVSGALHIGHTFSYTHTDTIARFQRMNGKEVFYPIGWDDNGLPTERRVQNYYGIYCDPSLQYVENFQPPQQGTQSKPVRQADQQPVSRQNFIELCLKLSKEDETQFEALWRHLGLSFDWSTTYQTIGNNARLVTQHAFLQNLARGEAYMAQAPGLWDVTLQTAVAQAEVEAREYPGHYYTLLFHGTNQNGNPNDIKIETTRPELLGACVALIAHPDDPRYQPLFGSTVTSPGFGVEIPVLPHPQAEKNKGTGIAMCCTFGDLTDVQWWRELKLPLRAILEKDGRITNDIPPWITEPKGKDLFASISGKTVFTARKILSETLQKNGETLGEPTQTQRMANFFEKGDKPLEIVTSRQWYVRNGGKEFTRNLGTTELREELLKRGKELNFHPDFMRVRYDNWVNGLNSDWLISRQRFFGVPIPVWYKIGEDGTIDYTQVLTPTFDQLPMDPSTDVPTGYCETQRDKPLGFHGEVDIMDTWMTSSLTPQIPTGWLRDNDLYTKLFPMSMRAQGQDILRTWLFSTILRSNLQFDVLPWENAAISGWILDTDRKKMSKSKGNAVTPATLLEKYGSDAVRYWASCAKLGTDATFDESQVKIGRRLAIKLLNASKFALSMAGSEGELTLDPSTVKLPVDAAIIASLNKVIKEATETFGNYDHAAALHVTENFFWTFCDDYIELVKDRAYNAHGNWSDEEAQSARSALALVVDALIRLLAPFLPFATEEAWSWYQTGSVHTAKWPTQDDYRDTGVVGNWELMRATSEALIQLRKIKSEAKVSPRTPYLSVSVKASANTVELIKIVEADLRAAVRATNQWELVTSNDADTTIEVSHFELGETPPKTR